MATAKKTAPKPAPAGAAVPEKMTVSVRVQKRELRDQLGAIASKARHGDHREALAELAELLGED